MFPPVFSKHNGEKSTQFSKHNGYYARAASSSVGWKQLKYTPNEIVPKHEVLAREIFLPSFFSGGIFQELQYKKG